MASPGWRTNSALNTLVFERYDTFNVFQLVRVLLWKLQRQIDQHEADAPLHAWPVERRLRFRADLSDAFPAREFSQLSIALNRPATAAPVVHAGRQAVPNGLIHISTANYCIASTLGPLPEPFTEWVRDLEREREPAMADFLNMFNQRLNLLRFQLKMQQTLALNYRPPAETRHAGYLAAFMGLGQPELAAQVPLPPRAWLALAGMISNRRRSATAIVHALSLFLSAKVKLVPLVGAWQKIDAVDRLELGLRNHRLGRRTVLGNRVWDQQARIRLEISALDYRRFCELLPDVKSHTATTATTATTPSFHVRFVGMLRLLLDRLCDCEVQLFVTAAGLPPSRLTARPQADYRGLRLSQTAWLQTTPASDAARPVRAVAYLIRAYEPDHVVAEAA